MLARKPVALHDDAPCKAWVLPATIERNRRKLASTDDGNRQMTPSRLVCCAACFAMKQVVGEALRKAGMGA